jgi:methyl-galactoside transport system substrate-binding protein
MEAYTYLKIKEYYFLLLSKERTNGGKCVKKHIRYIGAICVFVLLIVICAACVKQFIEQQKESEKIKSIKIGICLYDEYDTYVSTLIQEISTLAKKKEMEEGIAITVDIQSAGGSQITQNDQIDSFVDKQYDVLCVSLVDRTDASAVIDKAKSADIPIIFFNRELVEEDLGRWDKIYYVGADSSQSGNLQGQIIVNECDKNFSKIDKNGDGILQYVMLEGEPGHQDAMVRTENSVKTVINAGYTLQKLGDEIANWNRAQATTKMAGWIEAFGEDIEVVFANNDDMALGALDALKKSKIENYPIIVGVDGLQNGLECVKKKEFVGTVYNDYRGQAQAVVDMAYALSMNQNLPDSISLINNKYVYIPYQTITYDNVQEYIRLLNKN